MRILPDEIQLTPEHQELIAEIASQSDRPWQELLLEILQQAKGTSESKTETGPCRKAGSAKGKIWIAPDFDEPLEEFKDYM